MNAAELGLWVTLLGALVMGGRRVLRGLVEVVKALEGVAKLSAIFDSWTEDMRTWQRHTDDRLVRLETIEEQRR